MCYGTTRWLARTWKEHRDLPFWAAFTKRLEGEPHVAGDCHVILKIPVHPDVSASVFRPQLRLYLLSAVLYRPGFLMPPRLSAKRVLSFNTLYAYARPPSVAQTRSLVTVLNVRPPRAGKGKACALSRAGPSVCQWPSNLTHGLTGTESVPCIICPPSTERPLPGAWCQEGC